MDAIILFMLFLVGDVVVLVVESFYPFALNKKLMLKLLP